jgi:mRNA-degrading endonuclease RelE of RelBE toxin-antitoxin system
MPWLTRRATKDLADLSPALRERARAVLASLDTDPALGKKLQGRLTGRRSARLGATHRIIYVVEERGVVVLTIQPRRDAYR